jgi:SAM-dependent methyltransferase
MQIYKQPLYYEIAFSFANPKKQVDGFEKLIKKFSEIKVGRFLDIACGTSLQLREIAKRGYEAVGLDLSAPMLSYLKKEARREKLKIETVKADMTDFKLKKKSDFAFIMMGSFTFESNERLLGHLDSVAASLNKGGLYFIQNLSLDWADFGKQSWTMKGGGIKVKTTYERIFKNMLRQIFTERLVFEINDKGKKKKIVQQKNLKFVFPQELKALIKLNGKFDFLGWWKGDGKGWHLDQPLEKAKQLNGNFALLRRK